MEKLKQYMIALRPWSFSASLTPVMLGSALAYNHLPATQPFSFLVLVLTLVIALSVHGAGNLVNTYYDFKNGVDTEQSQSDRTLVDKVLRPEDITRLGVFLYFLGSMAFFVMLFVSRAREEVLALIYFGGLSLSFTYTGGIGFKYMALGDLIIVITFGPLTVLFAFVAQMGSPGGGPLAYLTPLAYALPLALNTEAILHSNNTRDLESDKRSGIFTLAIYLGFTGAYVLYTLLIFVPYFACLVMALKKSIAFLLPLLTVRMAFALEKEFRARVLTNLPAKTAKLNLIFGLFYALSVFMAK